MFVIFAWWIKIVDSFSAKRLVICCQCAASSDCQIGPVVVFHHAKRPADSDVCSACRCTVAWHHQTNHLPEQMTCWARQTRLVPRLGAQTRRKQNNSTSITCGAWKSSDQHFAIWEQYSRITHNESYDTTVLLQIIKRIPLSRRVCQCWCILRWCRTRPKLRRQATPVPCSVCCNLCILLQREGAKISMTDSNAKYSIQYDHKTV